MKEQGIKFTCVISELPDTLASGQVADENNVKAFTDILLTVLAKENLEVKVECFKDKKILAILTLSGQSKRYQEMRLNRYWM